MFLFFSLPGKEALYDPGNKAGQMKMIRENNTVMAYTWVEDGDQSHWEKVGEVLGGSDKDEQGRTQYEGQVTINTLLSVFRALNICSLKLFD